MSSQRPEDDRGPFRTDPLPVDSAGRIIVPVGFSAAELHSHTTHSDGTCTAEENFTLARDRGLAVVATTDHDMIGAALGNRTTIATRTLITYKRPSIGARLRNQRRSLLYLPYYRLRAVLTGRYL